MTKDEMKNKCAERTRIFQQAMESCKSSNPIDCIEWFADRIADLEKENAELKAGVEKRDSDILTLKGLTERQRLKLDALEGQTPWKDIKDKSELIGKLTKAKEIIRNIIRVTWGEGWNYSLEWKVKAEQFLKEVEK